MLACNMSMQDRKESRTKENQRQVYLHINISPKTRHTYINVLTST